LPGHRIIRTASWRGPEHFHSAVFEAADDTIIEITPDEAVAPPGDYRISVSKFAPTEPSYAGERAMSLGADFHARHYFGEQDTRAKALAKFQVAGREFTTSNNHRRQADAIFEEAATHYDLGNNKTAYDRFRHAEEIWRSLGDERGVASTENLRGLISWLFADDVDVDSSVSAIVLFESAAERRKRLGDAFFYAQAINNLGLVYRDLGDARRALRSFEEALTVWQRGTDLRVLDPDEAEFSSGHASPWLQHAVIAMTNLGWAYEGAAKIGQAERSYRQALKYSEHLGRGRMAAEIQNNLGSLMYRTGNLQAALDYLLAALAYFRSEARDETWAATVYNNLGLVYAVTGDSERAKLAFGQALRIRTPERDPIGRVDTLRNLALVHVEQNKIPEALALLEQAAAILEPGPVTRIERASLHDVTGRVLLADGQVSEAILQHSRAIKLFAGTSSLLSEIKTRTNLAFAYHSAGQDVPAFEELEVALELAEQVESLPEMFRIQSCLAQIHADRREYGLALTNAKAALAISDTLRKQLTHPVLLREYAAVQRDVYDVVISSNVALGDFQAGWIAADESRARRFTELLRYSGTRLGSLDATERARYEVLHQNIAALAEQRSEYLAINYADLADQVRAELAPLVDELDELLARTPEITSTGVGPINLQNIQDLLGDDDVLLEYHLGASGSGVWRIRADGFEFFKLPDTAVVEGAARNVRQSIRPLTRIDREELDRLSAMLLGAAIDSQDHAARIIVIPDGFLDMVPFAALLDPGTNYNEPLIVSRDVTYLPSAGSLLELRARERNVGAGLAVLADPVFEFDDTRIRSPDDPKAALRQTTLGSNRDPVEIGAHTRYPRLPASRDESRAILNAAGDIEVFVALDTDANRELVTSGRLNDFKILHFATHGRLDVEEPALSALVLSGVSDDGRQIQRFLRTQDIVALDLKADLVVLSGCDTGTGKAVRGEGLISLSRAFFYAGAEQVISSLWQVPDRSTATLMNHFYRELLQNGKTPATALRLAQLAVRTDRRWSEPYYWAAFFLNGDWSVF
jgi:CHAT domain-containing protein/Tfp pilus assembly protein PilF